jgi:hypothetical protein
MMLLAIDNLPAHVWSPETVQIIIASACLNFEIVLALLNIADLFRFFVVAWAIHLNLISVEVGCVVLEPEGESVIRVHSSSLGQKSSCIRSKTPSNFGCSCMCWRSMTSPSRKAPPTSSSDDGDDGYPVYDVGRGLLQLWLWSTA